MTKDKNISKYFYQNLGKLFYAIAIADGKIETNEIEVLIDAVTNDWSSSENGYLIVDVFNWLNTDKEYTADHCFDGFIEFKNANRDLFTEDVNKKILDTAIKIASSFSKTNKSELMLLAKLEIELNKK